MKTIFLIDNLSDGHHTTYMKFFSKAIIELGHKVVLLCPNPEEVKKWVTMNSSSYSNFDAFFFEEEFYFTPSYNIPVINTLESIFFHTAKFSKISSAISEVFKKNGLKPDLVFFLFLDNCMNKNHVNFLINMVFKYKWTGLYFWAGKSLEYKNGILEKLLPFRNDINLLNSNNCQSVCILNEYAAGHLKKLINKEVYILPDFADNAAIDEQFEPANEIRQKANGRKIVCLIGALDRRKSVLTLLKAAELLDKNQFYFVIAGKFYERSFSEDEKNFILNIAKTPPENFYFYLQTIPDENKFNAFIKNSDYLFAVYENFPNSSNILTKAAIFKKMVITSNRYCMAERNIKYHLGVTATENDPQALAAAISELPAKEKDIKANFDEYLNCHSIERLYKQLTIILNNDGATK
ncbi:MAG: glycosyltransferase [Candidatus Wallbacteria bacterium]